VDVKFAGTFGECYKRHVSASLRGAYGAEGMQLA
jgi:hypothetical protein